MSLATRASQADNYPSQAGWRDHALPTRVPVRYVLRIFGPSQVGGRRSGTRLRLRRGRAGGRHAQLRQRPD